MAEAVKISLVIPVYNEEANLAALMKRILVVMERLDEPYEVVFVDDGSRDRSLDILKGFAAHPRVRIVELARNYGQHAAILSGFSVVRGDMVVTLDADLQNPPEEIPNLIRTMVEGDYDVVGTVRVGRKDPLFRTLPSKVINAVTRRITKCNMTDWGCMLRAYRRSVVDRMVNCHEQSTFIPALATHFAKRITEIEVAHEKRFAGKSNYSIRRLINLQFDLVSSFSDLPLKILMYSGIGMAIAGISLGFLLLLARLVYGALWAVGGVFTLFALLFTFVGFQFFALGVMGEYISRIYREVRRRPEFVIEKVHAAGPLEERR
jgi:undecaprenyl-phosphate 4-deoxy-4-formamido-L-arabinose transferase